MSHRSRRSLGAVLLLATAALVAAAPSHAGPKPKHHVRPHLDVNATASARAELANPTRSQNGPPRRSARCAVRSGAARSSTSIR